ncbi:MAG TPA: MFS transporter [Cycloclasticus sp.]|jgi:MFS family permease|nr:MFS transporter [Cycloclasticus sp.]HIL91142.1 MFS transporter [Cycloclasticus sp.]
MNTTTHTEHDELSPAYSEELKPHEIVSTVIMTRVSEYFGFFVFAIACALVFPQVYFPNYDLVTGTLISFSVFSLAFLTRPFARLVFGRIDKEMGRGVRITVAMFLLGASSIIIGFIPSYEEIGIVAPILLCIARIGQGIGSGGSADGLPMIMMMNAPEEKRGRFAMVPQLGAPIGFAIAASVYYILTEYLTPIEFFDWGWRFPFIVVLALQVVALFTRLRLVQTEGYNNAVKQLQLRLTPTADVVKRHWKDILLATYLPLASYTLLHLITIFPLGYIKLFSEVPVADLLIIQVAGAVVAIFTCAMSGVLSDRFGRRPYQVTIFVMVGILSFFIGDFLANPWSFMLVGYALFGLCFGQSSGTLPHRFKKEYRYTAVLLSTDLSWIFGAAFAPIIAISLTVWFGPEYAGYYLLSGVLATLLALRLAKKKPFTDEE